MTSTLPSASSFSSSEVNHDKALHPSFLINVMSKRQKRTFVALVGIWAIALGYFWYWWLSEEHILSWLDMIFISLIIGWQTLLPAYYFYFVYRMKRPNPALEIPSDWRIAMVVTKAPSEPWLVVQRTLEAMLDQAYSHDVWLADEQPQSEARAWCEQHGVHISSREGIAAYHQPSWPRRTRCKEGNLAYFYDMYGYDNYDIVVQLDADHVPELGYLEAMIRPFIDSRVGYVAAPSICDANAEESWVVNARAFAEGSMHGSLQAGYNDGWAPLCIGSHYAVRVSALKQIGGLGPELAEDHSTTLMMNAHGWRGIFAFDAEAHGDGPASFPDFLVQEFQWSRSLTTLLLSVTPRYWKRLPPRLKFQFGFSQLWYPLYAMSLGIGISLPIIALVQDVPWVNVSYLSFLAHSFVLDTVCIGVVMWVNQQGWFRPKNAKVISWETLLFQLARWPWILAGVLNAVFAWILSKELPFRVTPKGMEGPKPLPMRVLMPYCILAIASALTVLLMANVQQATGYYFLAMLNGALYVGLSAAIVWAHLRENKSHQPRRSWLMIHRAVIGGMVCLLMAAFGIRGVSAIEGVAEVSIKRVKFVLIGKK